MRRTKEDAEITRQSLLDAALKVFAQKGYASARLEDVAEIAGVTRGAIYFHFHSKSELFQALVDQAGQSAEQVIQLAIQEGGSFLDVLRRVLLYSLRLVDQDARFRGAMALFLYHSGDTPELNNLRSLRIQRDLQQMQQIAGYFRMGIEQGALPSDLDPDAAAYAFLAYQNGLVSLRLLAPGALSAQHDAALAEIFVRGVASPPAGMGQKG